MRNVSLDEQRHIGFGVKLLRDLAAEDREVPEAVAEQLRAVTPVSLGVFVPPNWDTSYVECFGSTLEQVYEEGARSFEAKFRAAGLPIESLPGPQIMPMDLQARGHAERGLAMLRYGLSRAEERPGHAGRPRRWRCCSRTASAATSGCAARPTVRSSCSRTSRTPSRGTCGSTTARRPPRRAARAEPDLELRCRFDDLVRRGGRTARPAARRIAAGRLRPRGTPRALWRARGLFTAS